MKAIGDKENKYFKELENRGKKSRVHRSYQFVGLEIAVLLQDLKHKSLYIKLAKQYNPDKLMELARDISDKAHVDNKGAYFMKVLKNETPKFKTNANRGIK